MTPAYSSRAPRTENDHGWRDQIRSRGMALSRSPHPYHRRSASVVLADGDIKSVASERSAIHCPTTHHTKSSSPSDSGTEADDERGHLLKGLPAPPLRSHKGLRGASPLVVTPAISPPPTPPTTDQERKESISERADAVITSKIIENEERRKVREKYNRQKRAEIVRRVTETILLLATGFVVSGGCIGQYLLIWRQEVIAFTVVILGIYFSYPFRGVIRSLSNGVALDRALKRGFFIPSRFDPGPLLYPVLLPSFVAISLLSRSPGFLVPNLMLGISSVPSQALSVTAQTDTVGTVQWSLSIIPLSVSNILNSTPYSLKRVGGSGMSTENLVLLCPLQKALIPILEFLTTTSLDRSELELLSTALINLLLFGTSPQMQILKALLWLGGLALFISCSQFLSWQVALARIPNWKFSGKKQKPVGLVQLIDYKSCELLAKLKGSRLHFETSEDEATEDVQSPRLLGKPKLDVDVHLNGSPAPKIQRESHSAVEPFQNGSIAEFEALGSMKKTSRNQRRNTLSDLNDSRGKRPKTTRSGKLKRSTSPKTSSFLSLSLDQALVRKWLYAFYVYGAVLVIILAPIRRFVSLNALSAAEPFGWALGYLFGNIAEFRYYVVSNNLERWVKLPSRLGDVDHSIHAGWLEQWRQVNAGPATTRLLICGYCCVVLMTGIGIVLRLSSVVEVDTRRKVFHGIMVAMLLPTVFVDPCFIALALVLILAIFLLLDLFRASQLPPISKPLTYFLAPYVDGRDHRGPVIVSPIFLLIGCAIPLWLSLAGVEHAGEGPWIGWDVRIRDVSMVSGVVCVGMGDAAASLIGRRYGKTKWYWGGGKSLEGSAAFVGAVTFGLMAAYIWLGLGGWATSDPGPWLQTLVKCVIAGMGASLLESTLTAANDNVVVPIGLWLLVRGMRI